MLNLHVSAADAASQRRGSTDLEHLRQQPVTRPEIISQQQIQQQIHQQIQQIQQGAAGRDIRALTNACAR